LQKKDNRPAHVVCVTEKDTLETVINSCATSGIHRIYVVDANKKPINVIALKDIFTEILACV